MTAVCEHVPYSADTALMVSQLPEPDGVPVKCPCCGMHGTNTEPDAPEPMRCPYCDVEAVAR